MPPSIAQAVLTKQQAATANGNAAVASNGEEGGPTQSKSKAQFVHTIKLLFTNPNYVLLIVSYGMNVGTFYAVSTLLNQIILDKFPLDKNPVSCHS